MYDGQLRIIAEQQYLPTGDPVLLYRFIYGSRNNTPEMAIRYSSGTTINYRIFSDHLGSPRYVVRPTSATNGKGLLEVKYSAFGIPTVIGLGSIDDIPFGFAGGHYDADTGLVRFGARDYDPMIGRWVSKDPSLFFGGINFYVYSHNDPVNYVDPDGKFPFLVVGAGLAALGITYLALDSIYAPDLFGRAMALANGVFPDRRSAGNNFLRHCVAGCIAQKELGDWGVPLLDAREYGEQFFTGQHASHCAVDRTNNHVGQTAAADVGASPGPQMDAECASKCMGLIGQGAMADDRG